MLVSVTIVLGYQFEGDSNTVFAEEQIFLADLPNEDTTTEDLYWDFVYNHFQKYVPKLGDTKAISGDGKLAKFLAADLRKISYIDCAPSPSLAESPQFVASMDLQFDSLLDFQKYMRGISDDEFSSGAIRVRTNNLW